MSAPRTKRIEFRGLQQQVECQFQADCQNHDSQQDTQLFGLQVNANPGADLCADNAGGPACQRACPHDALRRVDMRDLGAFAKWVSR